MRHVPAVLLLAAASLPAHAADAPAIDAELADDLHRERGTDIIITAPFARDRADLLSGVSVLEGAALARETRSTIGDTLSRQAGVSSTSFGPNASRPILRGFQGERIRVLTDGIGSFDVANTSVDHAVVINPLLAKRVEVVRGPSSLLFGSAAIGGVVNVLDGRIPSDIPQDHPHLDAIASYGTAAKEGFGAASADISLGGGFVFHADGSYLKSGNLRTGGYIYSQSLREEAEALGDDTNANLRGRIANSQAETWNVAGGLAYIDATSNFGFAVSHYDSLYGIPGRFTPGSEEEPELPRLDMQQTRIDARADIATFGFIDRVKMRFGAADYTHAELEPSGEAGTIFNNKSLEGRLELVQRKQGGWQGASGVQFVARDFEAIGEEAFIPRNNSSQFGIFTLQQFDLGAVRAEIGGRYEHSAVNSAIIATRRSFDAFSASAGASIALAEGWRLGLNLSHSERAPAAEELLAFGPHAGTQAFEIGNPDFVKERANGIELVLRGQGDSYRIEISGFYTNINDFIYDTATGEIEEESGLPIFQYFQEQARYYGAELDADVTFARLGDTALKATVLADFVRAEVRDNGGPIPRIPPFRIIAGLEADGGPVDGRIDVEHATRQSRIAALETETPAYTLVNASLSWKPFGMESSTALTLSANNIFDVEARRHASFLKDFAPLAGRDVRLGIRASF